MKIGLRSIKTGIAVALTVIICNMIQLGTSFFGAVAAVIALQATIADSFQKGKERLLGTVIGAVVGIVFSMLPDYDPLWVGLGVIVVITISNMLKWKDSIVLGNIVFCAIMLNNSEDGALLYGLNRFIETFIGIATAISINYLIKPPKIDKRVKETIEPLGKEIYRLWNMSIKGYFFGELEEQEIREAKIKIDNLFQKANKSLGQFQKEILYRNVTKNQDIQFDDIVRSYQHLYDHGKSISKIAYEFQGKPLELCPSLKEEAEHLLMELHKLEYYVSSPLLLEKEELIEEIFRIVEVMKSNIQTVMYQEGSKEELHSLLEFFTMIYHMERFMTHMKDF